MNVLDGERMAGQLEALGLARAADAGGGRGEGRHPEHLRRAGEGRGQGLQRARRPRAPQAGGPGPRRRRHRVRRPGLGRGDPRARAVGRLRRGDRPGREGRRARRRRPRRAAPGPGARASGGRPGLPVPPDLPRLALPGLRHGHRGLRPVLHVLHRPVHPGPGAQPRCRGDRRGGPPPRGAGYTEVTLLGQTVNAYREPCEGFGLGRAPSPRRRGSRAFGACAS